MTAGPLINFPPYYRCHCLLHHLWTKAGTTHYVKKEWAALEEAIGLLARPTAHGDMEEKLDEYIKTLDKPTN